MPDAMPPNIVKLDVIEVNVPRGRVRPVRPQEEGVALPVALGVTVKIPGHAFLRGRGIGSEWHGKLLVGGTMAAPDITGRLEVVRGRVDLLGQPFEIDTGRVVFAGGDTIDPELDFNATGEAADLTVRVHVTGVASAPSSSWAPTATCRRTRRWPRCCSARAPARCRAPRPCSSRRRRRR